ncbi:chemokine XC receptor 1-like [Poecilia formosa]|uniref:chemokine XC receptor 1-like n=1 Tax=Poecilia formosa TaxID=48698 RepID=UPI000443F704|nr:PREDICTED: chemokine XC receptor 1-like [Poecilia formosa]
MDSSLKFNYDCGSNVCEKSEVQFGANFSTVLFSIVISLSLIGNILVLVILALYENLKSLANILILNLAISDLVFTIGLSFWVTDLVWGLVFPDIVYKFLTFVLFIGFYSNIFFFTTMSGVCKYLTDVHLFNKSSLGFLSLSMWMISIAPARFHTYPIGTHNNQYYNIQVKIALQNFLFFTAFTVIAFCFIHMLITIKRTKSNTINDAVISVFSTAAVFFIGWIPYNVVNISRAFAHDLDQLSKANLDLAFHVSQHLAFSCCCLKPVVYAIIDKKFRSNLMSLLLKICRRQNPDNEEEVGVQNPSQPP